jgi:hypothetical protein
VNVRAKFRVTSVSQRTSWNGTTHDTSEVTLSAVTDDANKTWSKWTPGGELKMQINNPEALAAFKIGQAYFLDFSEAPQAEKDETR